MREIDLGLSALSGIALASLITAIASLLALRRWSDQTAVAQTKRLAQAHLLELRLFMDDPVQILRSQRALILDQWRIIRLLLPSFLIMAIPISLGMWMLDAVYGRAPLRVGEPAVVLVESRQASFTAPPNVITETPPVFLAATGETAWRIRPVRPVTGKISIGAMEARIVAGPGIAYLPEQFGDGNGIRITYPQATVFGFHWLPWFLLLSAIFALGMRRFLRVVF